MVIDDVVQAYKMLAKGVMNATARMVGENVIDRTGLLRDNLIDFGYPLCVFFLRRPISMITGILLTGLH